MRIIGIDPGQSGALCFIRDVKMALDPNSKSFYLTEDLEIELHAMPVNGKELDLHELSQIFLSFSPIDHAYLEKVSAMPGQGVSSMFKFGRNVGALQAMLAAHKIPYTEVTPQAWQKVMHEGASRTSMPDPKDRSLAIAKKLFPNLDLLATKLSKKPHHGFVDALLIAEYGRRRLNLTKQIL